jgi:hypothetical protein
VQRSNVPNGTYIAGPKAHSPLNRDSETEYLGHGGNTLRHINRYFSLLLLGAALAAPVAVIASPQPQEGNVQVRIYDRDHRDYHNWDDREDRAYRRYLVVQHRSYRSYQRQNYRVHRHYWQWRHNHPDND